MTCAMFCIWSQASKFQKLDAEFKDCARFAYVRLGAIWLRLQLKVGVFCFCYSHVFIGRASQSKDWAEEEEGGAVGE